MREVRKEFPVTKEYTYLNNASVSPLPRSVAEVITEYQNDHLKHGGIKYQKWSKKLVKTKQRIAELINASFEEIAFTQNTSEGLTWVAQGLDWKPGDNVIIPNIEFPANVYPWLQLETKGVEIRYVKCEDGTVEIDDIVNLIDENTKLLTVSFVQFATGYRLDLEKLGKICAKEEIYFVVDGIQGVGNLNLDVKAAQIDFLACGGHKWLLGIQGSGFFYCRQELLDSLKPVNLSWKSVKNKGEFLDYNLDLLPAARRFESATENKMGVCALGAGIKLLQEVGIKQVTEHIFKLLGRLINYLQANDYQVLSSLDRDCRSAILTFEHLNQPAEVINQRLLKNNVMVIVRNGAIRVSPHIYNTETGIDRLIDLLPD